MATIQGWLLCGFYSNKSLLVHASDGKYHLSQLLFTVGTYTLTKIPLQQKERRRKCDLCHASGTIYK